MFYSVRILTLHNEICLIFLLFFCMEKNATQVHAGVQGAIGSHDDRNNSSDKGGLIEVEQILKQKTFSRQVTQVSILN